MDNISIFRIYPFLPPRIGGLEKHVFMLTNEQRKQGCTVVIGFNQGELTSSNDIQVLPLIDMRKIRPQSLRDFFFYISLVFVVFFRRLRFDVVHIHGDWSSFIFGAFIRKLVGAKSLVASVHGELRKGRWALLYKYILRNFDFIYCTGASDARYLESLGLNNVRWQCSGIDAGFYEGSSNRSFSRTGNRVVVVANLLPVKNVGLVLDIAKEMPDVHFDVVGSGPMFSNIMCKKKHESIENVVLLGSMSSAQVKHILDEADVFLSTSLSEGTPTAMLEAMARGLPIVASNANDYSGVLKEGKNGFVINGFNSKDYVAVIDRVLRSNSLRQYISIRNLAASTEYGWPNVAKKITSWSMPR